MLLSGYLNTKQRQGTKRPISSENGFCIFPVRSHILFYFIKKLKNILLIILSTSHLTLYPFLSPPTPGNDKNILRPSWLLSAPLSAFPKNNELSSWPATKDKKITKVKRPISVVKQTENSLPVWFVPLFTQIWHHGDIFLLCLYFLTSKAAHKKIK